MSRLSLFGSLVLVALVAGACGDEDEEELASPGAHVSCLSCCGNGVKADDEECDDGNLNPQDGCTAFCTLARCGDGVRRTSPADEAEECDDGNDADGDGCSATCRREPHGDYRGR